MVDENKYWELVNQWHFDTRFISSSTQILNHPSIAAIKNMGPEVIPLILRSMDEHPFLTKILHDLTGEWPVKDEYRGNFRKIVECWRRWANKHGYQIKNAR